MEISVGEIIKSKRKEKGYTLSEFAKLIEISPGYLSQIENGRKTNPKLEIVLRIIHELDISIEMLLGIESVEDNYLSRIPSLLKLTLAKERNLKTLSEAEVLRKINRFWIAFWRQNILSKTLNCTIYFWRIFHSRLKTV